MLTQKEIFCQVLMKSVFQWGEEEKTMGMTIMREEREEGTIVKFVCSDQQHGDEGFQAGLLILDGQGNPKYPLKVDEEHLAFILAETMLDWPLHYAVLQATQMSACL